MLDNYVCGLKLTKLQQNISWKKKKKKEDILKPEHQQKQL